MTLRRVEWPMTDEPIDLSVLHPLGDALPAGIAARCAPLLAARREHATTLHIARWWWPALTGSLVVAAASVVLLALPFGKESRRPPAAAAARRAPAARAQLAEAVGVPRLLARSLTSRRPPSLSELLEPHR